MSRIVNGTGVLRFLAVEGPLDETVAGVYVDKDATVCSMCGNLFSLSMHSVGPFGYDAIFNGKIICQKCDQVVLVQTPNVPWMPKGMV